MFEYPERSRAWERDSGALVILAVPDAEELGNFAEHLQRTAVTFVTFREPDFAYELTALALVPSAAARRACANLPLALRSTPASSSAARRGREQQLRRLTETMRACAQPDHGDLLEHNWAVWCHLSELLAFVRDGIALDPARWRVPSWLVEHREEIAACLPSRHALERFTVLRGSGTALCTQVVEADKGALGEEDPYPAEPSAGDTGWCLSPETLPAAFAAHPGAAVHLVVAIAEAHATAAMSGGLRASSIGAGAAEVPLEGEHQATDRRVVR